MAFAVVLFFFLSLLSIPGIKPSNIESVLVPLGGAYLMKVRIGSPPLEASLIMDTGSDITWTQCTPCEECFSQDLQIFDPTKSNTYKNLTCGSSGSCPYNRIYSDSSETIGVKGTDIFTFTSANSKTTTFTNIIFGCGHKNDGLFPPEASGIVGLGRGESSLISQLSSKLEHKFSYCLGDKTSKSSGLLQIGRYASLRGDKYVSPLLTKNTDPIFYYLRLEGISVGGMKILNKKTPPMEGNIIIDSGTSLTYLDRELYQRVENALTERIHLVPKEYPLLGYKLCYDINSFNYIKDILITFHFQRAEIVLKKVNLFVKDGGMTCFPMMPSTSDLNVFGNMAQVNFQIEYDLERKQISFVPTDCEVYQKEVMKHNDGQRLVKGSPFLYLVIFLLFFANMGVL